MPKREASGAGAWTFYGLALAGAGVPLAWCRLVADEYILPEVVLLSAGLLLAAAATAVVRRRELPSLSTPLDRPLAAVLLATFGLTLVRDLTTGIVAGCVLAALFAIFKRAVPEEGD